MNGDLKQTLMLDDPYAILKVDRDASDAMIQSSYKTLSRTFHPDKHPPGPTRDSAQAVFVKFKNAHEILTDPVLRQVYDNHGHDGIRIVKINMHSSDTQTLYPTLLAFHQLGQKTKARDHMAKVLQQSKIEREDHAIQIRTAMEFPCSLQSTALFGEGHEPVSLPELSGASISVSTAAASDSKWDMSVGINSSVKKGIGSASGSINVGYKPQQGTQISSNVDISDAVRFSFGTKRVLASHTMITTTARTMPNSKTLALSVVSHRDLWHNMFRGTCALGMGSDMAMHYGLLSLTTLSDEYPTCTVKLNIGINHYPLKFSAKQDFDGGTKTGYLSVGWGPKGVEWKAIMSRSLTAYAQCSMGIQHATSTGLTWLLQAERGSFTFRVPISITTITNPAYWSTLTYYSLLTLLVDDIIGDIIHDSTDDIIKPASRDIVDIDSACEKTKQDAEQQLVFMQPTAEKNTERERQCNGLIIYQARYFVHQGQSLDATTQLQFWVQNSTLHLPSGSKSFLMGFYPLVQPTRKRQHRTSWLRGWLTTETSDPTPMPQLQVRYTFGDETYEITVNDTDELVLPNSNATLLGAKGTVR